MIDIRENFNSYRERVMEIIHQLQSDSKNAQVENLSLKSQNENLENKYSQEINYLKRVLKESEAMNSEIKNKYSKLKHEILLLEKRSTEMEHRYLDITSKHSRKDAYYIPSSFQTDRSMRSENKKTKSSFQLDLSERNEESSDISINTTTQGSVLFLCSLLILIRRKQCKHFCLKLIL